jgi:hypothetical protein
MLPRLKTLIKGNTMKKTKACTCPACRALDSRFPRDGRQLAMPFPPEF